MSRRTLVNGGLALAATALTPFAARAQSIPGPLVDPAKALIGKMSESLLGDIAGPFVSGQILDFLGLGGETENYERYFAEIEKKLDDIQEHLDAIDTQIGTLRDNVERLTSDTAALSEKITDVTTQQLLGTFASKANFISENFASYQTAVAALGSSDKGSRRAGARQLYELFGANNARAISVAMRDIQDAFVPRVSERSGLLHYQGELIVAAITEYAADKNNMTIPKYNDITLPEQLHLREIPNDGGVWAFENIHSGSHRIAREKLDGVVADTMRAFVSAQLQGMVLLSSAWLGTINAPHLRDHIDRNKRILAEFGKFPASVAKRIDDTVAANLKRFGKPLGPPVATAANTVWSMFGDGDDPKTPWRSHKGNPLSNEYIMWQRSTTAEWKAWKLASVDTLVLVERPWQYDNCRTVQVHYKPSTSPPKCDGCGGELTSVQLQGLGKRSIPRFDKTVPKNLAFVRVFV
ncbi:MAG: hypothetical protein E6G97_14060 [Alphaproteobacteria bacterium]|nr:MAG: hypothetical protein E6G97_14060 [Alphaproteobacteria bacterium]